MKAKDSLIALVVLALLGLLGYLWFAPAGLRQAPDIHLTTLDGDKLALNDLRGRPVLITFWATTCPGCIKEMPHLVELHNDYSQQGFKLIGISMPYDPPNQVYELVKRRGLPYTIALDINGEATRAFGDIRLTPTTFLIAPDGRIVQHTIGDLDMAALRARIEAMLPTRVSLRGNH
ncbi:peroxiredoxin family protein [Sulfuriflexus mobilis]|uniref:peroxiredoxin family protein n=1 Tax=Sulfuriflexus mobilis TaxID=1811807 RepID=UPI000F839322|nr:TlpA disulfide reductase family protein [Sulfuriflexus mobilis]